MEIFRRITIIIPLICILAELITMYKHGANKISTTAIIVIAICLAFILWLWKEIDG